LYRVTSRRLWWQRPTEVRDVVSGFPASHSSAKRAVALRAEAAAGRRTVRLKADTMYEAIARREQVG
jgi:hypothetical protein